MKTWAAQDAKAHFNELLDACIAKGSEVVIERGAEAAVLVPMAVWRQLQESAKPTLKQLLLADGAPRDLEVPERGQVLRRELGEVS